MAHRSRTRYCDYQQVTALKLWIHIVHACGIFLRNSGKNLCVVRLRNYLSTLRNKQNVIIFHLFGRNFICEQRQSTYPFHQESIRRGKYLTLVGLWQPLSPAAFQLCHPISFFSLEPLLSSTSLSAFLVSFCRLMSMLMQYLCRHHFLYLCVIFLSLKCGLHVCSAIFWILQYPQLTEYSFSHEVDVSWSCQAKILRRHLFWNASHYLMSATVILQHSDPYNNTDLTIIV